MKRSKLVLSDTLTPILPTVLIHLVDGYYSLYLLTVRRDTSVKNNLFERYDGEAWQTLPSVPKSYFAFALIVAYDEVYAIGGTMSSDNCIESYADVFALDLSKISSRWRTVTSMNFGRYYHDAWFYEDRIYVWGGRAPGYQDRSSGEVYDIKTNIWTNLSTQLLESYYEAANIVLKDRLYKLTWTFCEYYHPATATWTSIATTQSSMGVFCNFNGKLCSVSWNQLEVYDEDENIWEIVILQDPRKEKAFMSTTYVTALSFGNHILLHARTNAKNLPWIWSLDLDSKKWTPFVSFSVQDSRSPAERVCEV